MINIIKANPDVAVFLIAFGVFMIIDALTAPAPPREHKIIVEHHVIMPDMSLL